MCMTHVTYSQWSKNSSGEGTKKCLKMGTFDLLISKIIIRLGKYKLKTMNWEKEDEIVAGISHRSYLDH